MRPPRAPHPRAQGPVAAPAGAAAGPDAAYLPAEPCSAPVSSVSAEALGTGGPPERGQTPRPEGPGARRRREGAQQRRQRVGARGCCSERFELATLL